MLRTFGIAALALVLLSGCGAGSKQDIMNKIGNLQTKDEVEKALGKADKYEGADIPLLGKTETLIYKASDGEVAISFLNGKKVISGTGDGKKEK